MVTGVHSFEFIRNEPACPSRSKSLRQVERNPLNIDATIWSELQDRLREERFRDRIASPAYAKFLDGNLTPGFCPARME